MKIFKKLFWPILFIALLAMGAASSFNTIMYNAGTMNTAPLGLKFNASSVSNSIFGLIGSASTVTIYSTNQFWKMEQSSNVTFSVSSLHPNIIYILEWTNSSYTVTYDSLSSSAIRWINGSSFSDRPSLQDGVWKIAIQISSGQTNGWIISSPEYNIIEGDNISFSTNNTTKVISFGLKHPLTNVTQVNYQSVNVFIAEDPSSSNIVINTSVTNDVNLSITNNITMTNWVGINNSKVSYKTYYIYPYGANRSINYGLLGRSNPGYGVAIHTNAANQLWTTLTNGKVYVLSYSINGTNVFATISLWE